MPKICTMMLSLHHHLSLMNVPITKMVRCRQLNGLMALIQMAAIRMVVHFHQIIQAVVINYMLAT